MDGFQAGGNLSYISLFNMTVSCRVHEICLNIVQRPVPEYLCSNIKLNFEEGNDNEEADNNLHFIGTDVDRSC